MTKRFESIEALLEVCPELKSLINTGKQIGRSDRMQDVRVVVNDSSRENTARH